MNKRLFPLCLLALICGLLSVISSARADLDIVDGGEDPLIEALKKNKPPLWTEKAAQAVALMEREKQCTLIEFLRLDPDGKPDIQFDDADRLLIHDKAGHKLVEIIKLPASRMKQDLAITVAESQDEKKLNPETRKQLNLALYGQGFENGPKTHADLIRGAKRQKDAVDELSWYGNAKRIEKLQQESRGLVSDDHFNACKQLMDKRDLNGAIDECTKALELNPDLSFAYLKRAVAR